MLRYIKYLPPFSLAIVVVPYLIVMETLLE